MINQMCPVFMDLALENQHNQKMPQIVKSLIAVANHLSVPPNCLTLLLVFKRLHEKCYTWKQLL